MDTYSDIIGKPICVINTCTKEPYIQRRISNAATHTLIQEHGFILVELICDPSLTAPHFEQFSDTNTYRLTLPLEETYTNLPQKMMSCYEFFSYYDIQGILKLDDDVSLSPDHAEDVLYPANFQYDYIGAELYWLVSGSYPITKSSNERFTLAIGDETLYFFAGPFYWVSRAAILKIVESGVRVPWEDVNVGYALSQWNECRVAKPYWFRMGAVRWEC